MESTETSLQDFGASFKGFLDQMASAAPKEEPFFVRRLREHFGTDPSVLPIMQESFPIADHPNCQRAMDEYVAADGRTHELLGIASDDFNIGWQLSALIAPAKGGWGGGRTPTPGSVQYTNINLGDDDVLACVQSGLYLICKGDERIACYMHGKGRHEFNPQVHMEVMSHRRESVEEFLAAVRKLVRKRNVYRGRIISLRPGGCGEGAEIEFHAIPQVQREGVILPPGLLERLERHTLGFAEHCDRLREAGRHLKRGILLHGPPGTGKTLTAMYLAGRQAGRTVIMLTGAGLGLIEQACSMARMLVPSTVILEDVDLVAHDRTEDVVGRNVVLFELLNQMDGMALDADVQFLLMTNRPDILEPALASRPGRIDQAIEIPLPDAECRRRLFELYSQGLTLRVRLMDHFVERTDGASAAFIRELLRKAALFACDDGPEVCVEDRHLDEALRELVVAGGALTRRLLGGRQDDADDER